MQWWLLSWSNDCWGEQVVKSVELRGIYSVDFVLNSPWGLGVGHTHAPGLENNQKSILYQVNLKLGSTEP